MAESTACGSVWIAVISMGKTEQSPCVANILPNIKNWYIAPRKLPPSDHSFHFSCRPCQSLHLSGAKKPFTTPITGSPGAVASISRQSVPGFRSTIPVGKTSDAPALPLEVSKGGALSGRSVNTAAAVAEQPRRSGVVRKACVSRSPPVKTCYHQDFFRRKSKRLDCTSALYNRTIKFKKVSAARGADLAVCLNRYSITGVIWFKCGCLRQSSA